MLLECSGKTNSRSSSSCPVLFWHSWSAVVCNTSPVLERATSTDRTMPTRSRGGSSTHAGSSAKLPPDKPTTRSTSSKTKTPKLSNVSSASPLSLVPLSGAIYGFARSADCAAQSADRAAQFPDPHNAQLICRSRNHR